MLLHHSSLMEVHYELKYDLLRITWPPFYDGSALAIEQNFAILSRLIQDYYITRVLADARSSMMNLHVNTQREIVEQFARVMSEGGVKKFARIGTPNLQREATAFSLTQHLKEKGLATYEMRQFDDEASAIAWLTAKHDW